MNNQCVFGHFLSQTQKKWTSCRPFPFIFFLMDQSVDRWILIFWSEPDHEPSPRPIPLSCVFSTGHAGVEKLRDQAKGFVPIDRRWRSSHSKPSSSGSPSSPGYPSPASPTRNSQDPVAASSPPSSSGTSRRPSTPSSSPSSSPPPRPPAPSCTAAASPDTPGFAAASRLRPWWPRRAPSCTSRRALRGFCGNRTRRRASPLIDQYGDPHKPRPALLLTAVSCCCCVSVCIHTVQCVVSRFVYLNNLLAS